MSRIVVMRTLALVVLVAGVAAYAVDAFDIGLFFLFVGIFMAIALWPSRRRGYRGGHRGSSSAAAYDWHHNDSGGWDGGSDGGGSDGGGGGDGGGSVD